ncbi:MAG: methyltransferase domain-containing protein [Thermoleophilia bacterium]
MTFGLNRIKLRNLLSRSKTGTDESANVVHSHRLKYQHLISGRGMEIGALNCPYPVLAGVEVLYSDVLTPEQIDASYPGSKHPDIVSNGESYPTIDSGSLDFVIANHVLEHVTDPIGSLAEWHRILKPGGILLIAVPDKRFTFDRERQRTTLAHLIQDHGSDLDPAELNIPHLKDWATHVEKLQEGSPEWREWVDREIREGYSVHNHVWVMDDLREVIDYLEREKNVSFAVAASNDTQPGDIEFIFALRAD